MDAAFLQRAALEGRLEDVQRALDAGLEVDSTVAPPPFSVLDERFELARPADGENPADGVGPLVGDESHEALPFGMTPFLLACRGGHRVVAELLLARGADPRATLPQTGMDAIMVAALAGNTELVGFLLEQGLDLGRRLFNGLDAFLLTCTRGHAEAVRTLVALGADPHSATPSGENGLYFAALEGNEEVGLHLLELGVSHRVVSADGSCPLSLAAGRGCRRLVEALLDADAEIESGKDGTGTAVWWATHGRHREVVKLLLERGARVVHCFRHEAAGWLSPLDLAAAHGDAELAGPLARTVLDDVDLSSTERGREHVEKALGRARKAGHEEVVAAIEEALAEDPFAIEGLPVLDG